MIKFSMEDKQCQYIGEGDFKRCVKLFTSPESEISTKEFAVGMTIISPGKLHEVHAHEANSEVQIIYEGEGLLIARHAEEVPVAKGDVISFGNSECHGFKNIGNIALKIIWIYYPPGLADSKFLIRD